MTPLPTNKADATVTATDHATHHNDLAVAVNVLSEAPINVQHPDYGASPGASAAANGTALAAALAAAGAAGGGDVLVPSGSYSYDTTLAILDGVRLVGMGTPQRLRSSAATVKLTYTGTGRAVKIQNGAGDTRESSQIHNVRFDGTGLSGSVDGLLIDGTAGDASHWITGLQFVNCSFTNFPRHQVLLDGLVFDIDFDHCAFHNKSNISTNALVKAQQTKASGAYIGQISFREPFMLTAGAGWCVDADGLNLGNARFYGGTVTAEANGSSGIAWRSGLFIYGTHLEGKVAGTPTGVGILYSGAQAAILMPSYCGSWSEGIQIGDPADATERANGAVIAGVLGGNVASDVHVLAGGSRRGTILLAGGEQTGAPVVVDNDKFSVDGESQIINLTAHFPYQLVTAAANITVFGDLVGVNGTTNITSITAGYPGQRVALLFYENPTVVDGSNLKLAGNFVTTPGDTLTLVFDGSSWYETGRSSN